MPSLQLVLLAKGCSYRKAGCVNFHLKQVFECWHEEYWFATYEPFQRFKRLLSCGSPFPGYVLLCQLIEGFRYVRESLDEASVEIDKACESPEFREVLRGFPSVYSCHLDWVHPYFSVSNNET